MTDSRNDVGDDLNDALLDSDDERSSLIADTTDEAAAFANLFSGPVSTNDEAHNAGVSEAQEENTRTTNELASANLDQGRARADAAGLRQTMTDWYGLTVVAIGQGVNDGIDDFFEFMSDPLGQSKAMIEQSLKDALDRWMQRHEGVMQDYEDINEATEGAIGFNQAVQIVGWHVASWTGIRKLIGGYTGQDPITGQKYRSSERFFVFLDGAMQLASTIGTAVSIYSQMRGPCGNWFYGRCFVGDTLVMVEQSTPPGTLVAMLSQETIENDIVIGVECPVYFVVAGVAGFMMLEPKRRRSGYRNRCTMPNVPRRKAFESNDEQARPGIPEFVMEQPNPKLSRIHQTTEDSVRSGSKLSLCRVPPTDVQLFESSSRTEADFVQSQQLFVNGIESPIEDDIWDETSEFGHRVPSFGMIWLLTCLMLALGVLMPTFSHRDFSANQVFASTEPDDEPQISVATYREIKDIRTGMRVHAENPLSDSQPATEVKLDPPNWRNVHLKMQKPDGSDLLVTLLRSVDWLKERVTGRSVSELERDEQLEDKENTTIYLDLDEIGAAGPATILAIEPCPQIEEGTVGRLVTGTFRHSSAQVVDVYVSSDSKPIGTTSNHPFWSESRQKFVEAEELFPGEELRTATGDPSNVVKVVKRGDSPSVYNLEVDGEHVYHVTSSGILVHNACDWSAYQDRIVTKFKAKSNHDFTGLHSSRNRIADGYLPNSDTAIEAKFIRNWSTSVYNPARNTKLALQKQASLVLQMKDYSLSMSQVRYYTNSRQMQTHLQYLAKQLGLPNVRAYFRK